jgi:hypothetical protein
MDQSPFAAPHGLSQRTASFIASCCQGIHQTPFSRLIRSRRRKMPFELISPLESLPVGSHSTIPALVQRNRDNHLDNPTSRQRPATPAGAKPRGRAKSIKRKGRPGQLLDLERLQPSSMAKVPARTGQTSNCRPREDDGPGVATRAGPSARPRPLAEPTANRPSKPVPTSDVASHVLLSSRCQLA